MARNNTGFNPRLDPQPVPKCFKQQDGMETNAINFDNPLFTLGRGRRTVVGKAGRNGAIKFHDSIVPPSQCLPRAGSGIFHAYDKPKGRG